MAYVAAGRFDGFFQKNLNIWDIAAGIVLVKEAGGILNDIDLAKANNHKIITSSPNINSKLIENLIIFNCFQYFFCYKPFMKNIHDYHKIKVEMTDGTQFERIQLGVKKVKY